MSFWRVLELPWRSTPLFTRVVAAVAVIVVAGVTVYVSGWAPVPQPLKLATAIWCIAVGTVWLLVIPNSLWLARDVHTLRVPKIMHHTDYALLLYWLVLAAIPAVALSMAGNDTLKLLVLFTAVAAGCLGWWLLPRRVFFVLMFVLFAFNLFNTKDHVLYSWVSRVPFEWIVALVILLAAVVVWRWRRLCHGESMTSDFWGPPVIQVFNRPASHVTSGVFGLWADKSLLRNAPDWLRAVPDFRHVGPEQPVFAIRVALGNVFVPKVFMGNPRQLIPLVLMLLVGTAVWFSIDEGARHVLEQLYFSRTGWVWLIAYGSAVEAAALAAIVTLRARWARFSAELPLLALLPRLGTPEAQKRSVLKAALGKYFTTIAAISLIAWAVAVAMHTRSGTFVFILLAMGASLSWLGAGVLCVVGGGPVARIANGPMYLGFFVLTFSSVVVEFPLQDHLGAGSVYPFQIVLLLAWFGWIVVCALLAWRGWKALQRRPHSFLANRD